MLPLLISVAGFGGFGHFNLSLRFPQISELSNYLRDKGYGELKGYFVSTGGSGYGVIEKVLIGGEGGSFIGASVRSESLKRTARIVGYLLYSNKRFNFYGILGIGGGSINITLIEDYSGSFDSAFVNPPRTAKFSNGSYLIKASLQGDVSLYGLSLGLKVGYSHALGGGWNVVGGPRASAGGPFLNIIVGGGFLF
ncbi:hypothetical protein LM594_06750 [Candidatus Caldipriscus sp.]|nr:hypothetical protein [Candidatus Caldipriscus sp.]